MNLQQPAPKLEGDVDAERSAATFDVGQAVGPLLASPVSERMSDADVRSLRVGERAELLALARRLLRLVPSPSAAREVVLAMIDGLDDTRSNSVVTEERSA